MPRNTIMLIWIAGIVVAFIAYATDPGALWDAAMDLVAASAAAVERLVRTLSLFGSDVMRALAIGLFVVFVAMSLIAIRQGAKARMALICVSGLFLLLLRDGGASSNDRWVAAFALAGVAALVMTIRVRRHIA